MESPAELNVLHHDFGAKLQSVHDALAEPLDPEAAECAIEVALLLREPMWRQAAWRDLDSDAALAAEAAVRLGFPDKAAALLTHLAGVREALGEWSAVEPLVKRAMKLGGDSSTRAEAMLHLGTAAHNHGHFARARSTFLRGLKIAPTPAMRHRILQPLYRTERALGRRDHAHGIVDELIRDVPPADKWFHAELKLDKATFLRSVDPAAALALANEARQIYLGLRFTRGEAYADLECARALRVLGEPDAALAHLSQAKAIFDRTRYSPGGSHVRFEQGRIAFDRGDFRQAIRLFDESYELAGSVNYFGAILRATRFQFFAHTKALQPIGALGAGFRFTGLLASYCATLVRARLLDPITVHRRS